MRLQHITVILAYILTLKPRTVHHEHMYAESLKKACFLLKFRAMVRSTEWPAFRQPISHSRKNLAQFSQPRTSLFEGLSNSFNYIFPRSYYDINSTNLNQIVDTKVIPDVFSTYSPFVCESHSIGSCSTR